jgi:serine/threonine protein kinase
MYEMMSLTENDRYLRKRLESFRHVKPEVRNLLERLLAFEPKERPSAAEALEDVYFKESEMFIPNLG